ncbi:MAG: M23 family metallopeptidase [Chloroflexi bacterium]|nr:M23 family metallopeptidase [Chloroflexota bacterium]
MNKIPPMNTGPVSSNGKRLERWLPFLSWGITCVVVVSLITLVVWQPEPALSSPEPAGSDNAATSSSSSAAILPAFNPSIETLALIRNLNPHTTIPDRPSEEATVYTVTTGDSVFSIAKDFNLKPESVLWANYDVLKDDPEMLSIGAKLNIPPEDGVYYKWKDGDTIAGVAATFSANPEDILAYPGNHLDMTNPQIKAGTNIMVPGGKREIVRWVVPTIPRGPAGVLKKILGPGACDVSGGAYGSGTFVWPAVNHFLSGNDYWSGHLGIDIAAGLGTAIYASDSGVVVYAGAIGGGYGNMIMIDHGNGYQTLYAHLSQISVRCGNSVSQGMVIGLAGSTGNSTGPHLHFEVRYLGGFINPWNVLP